MAFEKFHHKVTVGFEDDEPVKEKVTLPKFENIPFGLIRKNRKLPQEEQFFAILEEVADEATLKTLDKVGQGEVQKLLTEWQKDSGVEMGESEASSS